MLFNASLIVSISGERLSLPLSPIQSKQLFSDALMLQGYFGKHVTCKSSIQSFHIETVRPGHAGIIPYVQHGTTSN